jgi:hypothetical protein
VHTTSGWTDLIWGPEFNSGQCGMLRTSQKAGIVQRARHVVVGAKTGFTYDVVISSQ